MTRTTGEAETRSPVGVVAQLGSRRATPMIHDLQLRNAVLKEMKIMVRRQACCAQDDQFGPLEAEYEVDERCRLDEFLDAIERSGFLQFSSTHARMSCWIGGRKVGTVFGPGHLVRRKPWHAIDPASPVRDLASKGMVEFVFENDAEMTRSGATGDSGPVAPSQAWRALYAATRILLPLSSVLAMLALLVGLVAGFNLWKLDRPGVTIAWLTYVLLPIVVYRVVRTPPRSTCMLAMFALALWAPPCGLLLSTLMK